MVRPGVPKPLFKTSLEFDPRVDSVPRAGSTDAPITVVVNWPKLLAK